MEKVNILALRKKTTKTLGFVWFFTILAFTTLVTPAHAATYTQYPPYPDYWGGKGGGRDFGGYWFSWYYLNPSSGNIRVYALGDGYVGGTAWAEAYGFMGTIDVLINSPYVFVWNGSQYLEENDLIPASESIEEGADVTDYYKLIQPPLFEKGVYKLLIKETGHSATYLDYVQLAAVDHNPSTSIGVFENGDIVAFRDIISPVSAYADGSDVSMEIKAIDFLYYQGYTDSEITVDFGYVDLSEGAALIVQLGGTFKSYAMKSPITVQILDPVFGWTNSARIYPHVNKANFAIDLSDFSFAANLKVKFLFKSAQRLDFVGLSSGETSGFKISEEELLSALHSNLGEVKQTLNQADGDHIELTSGQHVKLTFSMSKPKTGLVRDFVLLSKGHYIKQIPDSDDGILIDDPNDPIVTVKSKLKLLGWAKVAAWSISPLAAWGRWIFRIWLYVWDVTSGSWATQTLAWSKEDSIQSPGAYIPVWRDTTWNYDKDIEGTFSATTGHRYRVTIGVQVYASGFAIGGDGYGLIDFDHSSYGDHDIWVKYIYLSW